MSPKVLDYVLAGLAGQTDANVLVGFDTADDAGVYKLTPECALVQTVDFFTPIVDDAHTFGAIAAANALSDVFAMGGRPVSALSILAWPKDGDLEALRQVLAGGAAKMREAGCALLGGHSIFDAEPKFGYSVTGVVHPDRVLINAGAREGDVLVFSKAIGTGVIATALKRGVAAAEDAASSEASMLRLNSGLRAEAAIHACTDVSGFGLLGHAREMAKASGVTLCIEAGEVPLLPGALGYARAEMLPGGLRSNKEYVSPFVRVERDVEEAIENLLYDPQTSGGLLLAVPEAEVGRLGIAVATIGFVEAPGDVLIRVL